MCQMLPLKCKTARCYQHRTALHRFSLAGCPERYKSDLRHLNYIISDASWQGAYFLYPFLGVATSQQETPSTVLETAVLPLNYAPIELTSDIIARYFLILQAFFLLFYTNLFFLRSLRFSIERGANIVFLPINPMILVI